MITILVEDCDHISQNIYDSFIHTMRLHQLTCSCGHSSCLTIHGYYRRNIRDEHSSSILRILRLRCSECGATHAILLSSIVPYSQISFSVQVNIAEKYDSHLDTVSVCESNPDISVSRFFDAVHADTGHHKPAVYNTQNSLTRQDSLFRPRKHSGELFFSTVSHPPESPDRPSEDEVFPPRLPYGLH